MASEVEISSLALNQLGEESIGSFDDGSKRSNLCRDFYPGIRDAVLRAYPWKCARVRKELPRLVSVPISEWSYQFTLPVDPYCLWVPKQLNEDLDYTIEGRNLLSNESSVIIVYIQRITNPGLFDSLLTEAIMARLASQLAWPLTGVQSLAQTMWALYEAKLREARTIDGMEGNVEPYESNALIEVR